MMGPDELGTGLNAEARRLIAEASGADDPSPADRERVKSRWLAAIAAGASISSLGYGARAAAGAGWGTKAAGIAAVLGALATGLYLLLPAPGPDDVPDVPDPGRRGTAAAVDEEPARVPATPTILADPSPGAPREDDPASEVAAAPAPQVERVPPEPVPAQSQPAAPAAPRAAEPTRQAPKPSAMASPGVPAVAPEAAPEQQEPTAAPPPGGQLGEELALLSQVRSRMQAGDAGAALELLGEYRERFAAPTLGMEAAALRVDALCQMGQRDAARAEARAFLSTWPRSPLTSRVSAACP